MGARKRAQKSAAKRKAARQQAAARRASGQRRSQPGEPSEGDATEGSITASEVNLGHVMALRPRVDGTYRPGDFQAAKIRLKDETYESIEAAARAVAETAVAITKDPTLSGRR